jgi:glycerol kinase
VGAGVYRDVEEAAAARPQTEGYAPQMPASRREAAYARWLDAVARVRTG